MLVMVTLMLVVLQVSLGTDNAPYLCLDSIDWIHEMLIVYVSRQILIILQGVTQSLMDIHLRLNELRLTYQIYSQTETCDIQIRR